MRTPQEYGEDKLVSIPQHNITISELHIGYHVSRAFAVINLVISNKDFFKVDTSQHCRHSR